jgi:hypothetical protein
MKNYSERIDEIFKTNLYRHRTLRTIFDPFASEWDDTTMDKKVEILKKITAAGEDLEDIMLEYQLYYKEINKPHAAKNAEAGLAKILQYMLNN